VSSGEPFEMEIRLLDRREQTYRWHLIRTVAVKDEAGRVVRWFGTSTDIHGQKRAEEAARYLAEASAALAGLVDYESTLQKVANLAVPYFADWSAVDVADGGSLRRLTNSNAIETNPAWSPKGAEIAFTSSRAGNPHIYLMDAEGANQRRLTYDGTYNDGASWSPDGDLIAYASRRDGRFQIAVTNVVTLETQVLTSGPGENESPAFSPDGRKIAFTSKRGGTKQIYVMDLDGANLRQLTTEGNNDLADWSRKTPDK